MNLLWFSIIFKCLGISYVLSVTSNNNELVGMNKDQVITCVNACAVHDTGLTCHSYNMTDVNMTNKTLVTNLYSYDDAFELK
jgi:hypothetical protein